MARAVVDSQVRDFLYELLDVSLPVEVMAPGMSMLVMVGGVVAVTAAAAVATIAAFIGWFVVRVRGGGLVDLSLELGGHVQRHSSSLGATGFLGVGVNLIDGDALRRI
jgi:hypothetical protein